ncbi:LppX_LprAFG lipoprotein [Solwaraspora sp. WMMD406]|uniref:LppX_LprAFG lipoprotein n=1 Tax=Solwaraspora sp. WMMD406 TaxID=3016095 RepID=UPI002415E6BD|nr:LppX_LprAFG lipoprotein [Solwaraspora sp. WMMD406]MDG4766468.1 LppX_LprAFG lipoprotein [Solwaraspora sp. WMMD406]
MQRLAQLGVASVAVLAVTACGSQASTPDGDTAAAEQPNVLALLASDATGSLQRTVETTGKAESVTVTMTGTSEGETVDMSGVIKLGDSPMAELSTTDPEDGKITIIMVGSAFYVSIPEADQASMEGKKWFKMDLASLGQSSDEDLAKQLEDMDPVKSVQTLLDGGDVTVVGEETIDGVPTVHYTSTTPVEAYLGHLDAELRDGVQEQLATAGVTEIVSDVWVDEQYQPRRVKLVMGELSDMTINYTDYGKPVSIAEPSAEETLDFAEMIAEMQDLIAEVEES